LMFEPDFSRKIARCSFMVTGTNPFHRDGVYLDEPGKPSLLGAEFIKDSKQPGEAAIIEQIAQVTLLRVILPYMIGKAFERLSEPEFIQLLGEEVYLPVPKQFLPVLKLMKLKMKDDKASLNELLRVAAQGEPEKMTDYRE